MTFGKRFLFSAHTPFPFTRSRRTAPIEPLDRVTILVLTGIICIFYHCDLQQDPGQSAPLRDGREERCLLDLMGRLMRAGPGAPEFLIQLDFRGSHVDGCWVTIGDRQQHRE